MGRRTGSRRRVAPLVGQCVFIATNWSWSETGVLNAPDLLSTDLDCPVRKHVVQVIPCLSWSANFAGDPGGEVCALPWRHAVASSGEGGEQTYVSLTSLSK